MGDIHSQLVGEELHIARTFVSTGDPNGVVTPGIIGEFYWDSDANQLYVAESLLNTSWVHTGSEFDTFLELTDTPADYTGNNNLSVQVNQGATGLVFGQALRPVDGPVFNGLELQQISTEDVVFQIIDSFPLTQFRILLDDSENKIIIDSVLELNISSDTQIKIISESTIEPLAISSAIGDTLPISTLQSIGTNGSTIQTFVGIRDPETNVTGNTGDHYWRVDPTDSTLFIKKTDGVNTGWEDVLAGAAGGVTTAVVLNDNFLVRGNDLETINIGNIFMSDDGNDLTIPGALDLIPPEPVLFPSLVDNVRLDGVNHITVVNNYAYVVTSLGNSLTIVDITDPNAMFVVGTLVDPIILTTLTSVHVSGKYAFVTSNITDCLNVIDITDVSAPVLVGRVVDSVAMDSPDDAFVASKFCYVIGQTSDSLAIVDISDPEAPFVAGSLIDAFNFTDPRALYVMGKFAYVTLLGGNLKIVDISDPTAPVIVGTFITTNMTASNQVYVVGRYAYVTSDFSDSFTIIDISDPTAPLLAGQIFDPTNLNRPSSLSIDGDYAYVGTIGPPTSVIVIDISDRTAPVIIETLVTGTGAVSDLFVSGKFAYIVIQSDDSITAVNLGGIDASTANIGNLSAGYISVDNDVHIKGLLTASGLDVGVHGIHSDGGISSNGALDVIPSQPHLLGSLTDANNLNGVIYVSIVNNYAYVICNGLDRFTILDVTDPNSPFRVSTLASAGNFPDPTSVIVSGKYAYITSSANNSLVIIDISNVFAPVFVSSVGDSAFMNQAQSSYVSGKFCYVVAFFSDSMAIVDISDPLAPVLVGNLVDTLNFVSPRRIYILGKFAYVSLNGGILKIVDISDPTSPVIVGSVTNPGLLTFPLGIYVVGRYAYLTSNTGDSLVIIDVSDSTAPTIVGSVVNNVILEEATHLSIAGDYAYVVTGGASDSIVVIDISDPTAPIITNNLPLGLGNLANIFVSGKYAYIAANLFDTFQIIDLHGIDASTASIGNVKAGYLSVDNEVQIKGNLYSGGVNAGLHGIHSDGDISGLTSFSTFDKGSDIAIARLKNTGPNPGTSNKFVGNIDPNGNVTGVGGDVYFKGRQRQSGTFESRGLTAGDTLWFKRSVKPPEIIEINNPQEFEALATASVITVSGDLTLIFNISLSTDIVFVVTGTLNLTGLDQANTGIAYTGTGTLFSGTGSLRILGDINISSISTGTLLGFTNGLVEINRADLTGWDSLGSFTGVAFLLRFVNMNSNDAGFTLTNCEIISVFNVAHIGASGMAGAMFTVNTNNPLSIMSFSEIKHNVTSTGSVFDLKSTINFDVDLIDINHVAAEEVPANITAPIFKQAAFTSGVINSVADASPGTATIISTASAAGGTNTTINTASTFFEDEIVTISGTTNYNGKFQIFNVITNVSFDIIEPFVGSETGSIDTERIDLIVTAGHGAGAGDTIKVLGTNFYNGFHTVLVAAATTIFVNAPFISTNSGTFERGLSLDETDFRVNAKDCVGISDSIFLASAFVNNNSTPTPVSGSFQDLLFGTVGSALIASTRMAKWRMTDELNGTFELISDVIFDGWITFESSVPDIGGVLDIRIKFQIDKGAGFVDLDDPVEFFASYGSGSTGDQNLSRTFPVKAVKGNLIKPKVVRDAGTGSPIFQFATMNMRQS